MKGSAAALSLPRSRMLDFVELTKPRIAVLVLFTVATGAILAQRGAPNLFFLLNTVLATALVAAGASALNQWLERHSDARMRRTEHRPLPAGRLSSRDVLLFGSALGAIGLIYLALAVQKPLPVAIAAFTFLSYVLLYTPLKRLTTLNTLVGAAPGALPPLIGWTAVTGRLDPEAVVLFLLVFLWQVPHFLAIAWIYREDYARAGLKMLPVIDPTGAATARQMIAYAAALMLVSFGPLVYHPGGYLYAVGALVLGFYFLRSTLVFGRQRDDAHARKVMHASLIYLPLLLALLLMESLIGSPLVGAPLGTWR